MIIHPNIGIHKGHDMNSVDDNASTLGIKVFEEGKQWFDLGIIAIGFIYLFI